MKKLLEFGGIAAGAVLVAFGIAALVLSIGGHNTVSDNLKNEYIVGSADMTPAGIAAAAKAAKLPSTIALPTCNVANKSINTGDEARCFAQYMRIHALEASGGQTYAQMGRYLDTSGKSTNDAAAAAKDPKTGQPVANPARDLWVQETALSTALNVSYMAEQLARFGLVVGIALLLSGLGFIILAVSGAIRGFALTRHTDEAAAAAKTAPVA